MYLTKSSYCKGAQCEKILWLTKYKKELLETEDNNPIFETGRKVGELAKGLFGDYEEVPTNESNKVRIARTTQLLKNKPNIITEASFNYNENFCSVDILKNDSDGVEIYEVKSNTDFKKINLDDPSYQYFVLTNLGLNVKKVCVVYLNKEYEREKEIDLHKLFLIKDITDTALEKQGEIKNNITIINDCMETHDANNEPVKELGMHCFKPYDCEFWQYCSRDLPKPNIFDVKGRMKKSTKFNRFYNKGKISFEDLENDSYIKEREKYFEQVDFELHDRKPKINKEEIKKILDSLKYPLYFIDYEAFQCAIPKYEKTTPYQQIPFQYSLHIIKEKGAPFEHKEFLAEIDDENIIRTFAESMISNLPENGSVIVYNQKFEKSLVNNKIAKMYPDLKAEIERINANIVDIWEPFENRFYYVKDMKGSSSLKYVLPALYPDDPKLDYSNLPSVHNGTEASEAFLSLRVKTPAEQKETREDLLKYCELDTYAMVKIWEKFKEVTGED